jgi:hypothetical protein
MRSNGWDAGQKQEEVSYVKDHRQDRRPPKKVPGLTGKLNCQKFALSTTREKTMGS